MSPITMSIFDIIKQARIGNSSLNISSATICYQIATENGWNENLDMSNQYNRDIGRKWAYYDIKKKSVSEASRLEK